MADAVQFYNFVAILNRFLAKKGDIGSIYQRKFSALKKKWGDFKVAIGRSFVDYGDVFLY